MEQQRDREPRNPHPRHQQPGLPEQSKRDLDEAGEQPGKEHGGT